MRCISFDNDRIIIQCVKYNEEEQSYQSTGSPIASYYSDMQSFSINKDMIIISYLNHKQGLIALPLSAFKNEQDAKSALQILQAKIK